MSCDRAETIVWTGESGAPLSISTWQPGLHFHLSIATRSNKTRNNGAYDVIPCWMLSKLALTDALRPDAWPENKIASPCDRATSENVGSTVTIVRDTPHAFQ